MKTLELLAVTDSLVETKETSGKYRLPRRNPLPKFGSVKNPFGAAADQKQQELKPEAKLAAPVPQLAKETAPAPAETRKPASAEGATKAVRHFTAEWTRAMRNALFVGQRWVAARAKASRRWFGRTKTGADVFRRSATAVQGELSLDNVKVVRNDLRDSDLEVVPLRSATLRKPDSGTAAAEPAQDLLSVRLHPVARAAAR